MRARGQRGLVALCVVAALAACGRADRDGDELLVLAAASLTEAFRALGEEYARADSGRRVRFSFAGSQLLATQVRAGLEADLIATADPELLQPLVGSGLALEPQVFATNRLVWILPRRADGATPQPERLLEAGGARLVLAAASVPAGRYAREALARLGLWPRAEAQLLSHEPDVKGVLGKVLLGEADLGLVYTTDVTPAVQRRVERIPLPANTSPIAHYPIAVLRSSRYPDAAQGFVVFLGSDAGRRVLERFGFGVP